MNRISLILAAACVLADGPPKAETPKGQAPAPAPLAITPDERAMLRGFAGRADAARYRAALELRAIDDEQREYLTKVAGRLGLKPEELMSGYTINVETLAVEPKAKGAK